ncbi:MAG: hypothetical protein HYV09_18995 [Deltaproteobacteria bacterium]|nr:hypothetical protein [Deltaproteobacteria bacterium]
MLAALSAVTTCFAIAVAKVLMIPIGSILFVAGWLACLSIATYFGPGWWRRDIRVALTSRLVIWRRGRLRRSIERRAISYARIHWHPKVSGVGDLELVRAVPTGALRRTLSITLPDIEAPDAVWAAIRGVEETPVLGDRARPLGQRLDPDERVLWTAQPAANRPWDVQRLGTLGIALVAVVSGLRALLGGVHALQVLHQAGLRTLSAPFGAMALAVGISVAAVLVTGVVAGYHAIWRPRRLDDATRYVVTDRRVLIQRGTQELHLDRDRIVDVIDAPQDHGLHDLFLVLGGKNAHAHALAGAFGEKVVGGVSGQLLPVLRGVQDSETVRAILTDERQAA